MESSVGNLRLDDLYRMVAHIYADRNMGRTTEATFAHFVEVCGMLTIHDRKKKREGVNVTDALCKALGWYFPLLAKLKIKSVEEIVFRKFPLVCPYCRMAPHQDGVCKQVRGTATTLDHDSVNKFYQKNWTSRPTGLDAWQRMFQSIYPRSVQEYGRSTIGLLEELGELAEAVRVFDRHPKYFLGEAADTFSYIMGIANEHAINLAQQDKVFSFENEFLKSYPGLCTQCGSKVCVCPTVPQATIGRMAKEISIGPKEDLFVTDLPAFSEEGRKVAHRVLERLGGYHGLTAQLPFDRGDTNRALVTLCLRMAQAVDAEKPDFADNLRAEAYRIAIAAKDPGTPRQTLDIKQLLDQIGTVWKELDLVRRSDIKSSSGLVSDFGDILDVIRVLFVYCSPIDEVHIRVTAELRAIRDALDRGLNGKKVVLEDLPAATPADLRRALAEKAPFDVIHFAGHANPTNLIFEDEQGNSSPVSLSAIADLVNAKPSVKCVVLNACKSVKNLSTSISPCTIGMEDEVGDEIAMEFSRGFYDALAANKSFDEAYTEGNTAAKMAGAASDQLKMIRR